MLVDMEQVWMILKRKAAFSSLFLCVCYWMTEYRVTQIGSNLRRSAAQMYERRSDKVAQGFTQSGFAPSLWEICAAAGLSSQWKRGFFYIQFDGVWLFFFCFSVCVTQSIYLIMYYFFQVREMLLSREN